MKIIVLIILLANQILTQPDEPPYLDPPDMQDIQDIQDL